MKRHFVEQVEDTSVLMLLDTAVMVAGIAEARMRSTECSSATVDAVMMWLPPLERFIEQVEGALLLLGSKSRAVDTTAAMLRLWTSSLSVLDVEEASCMLVGVVDDHGGDDVEVIEGDGARARGVDIVWLLVEDES